MMVAVLTNAFREERRIRGCIEQFKSFGLQHVVLCGRRSWNGTLAQDSTPGIAHESGAEVVWYGDWTSAQNQYNWGLQWLATKGFKWALIADADERWERDQLEILLDDIESCEERAIRAPNWHVYWKTPDWEIEPPQEDHPFVAMRTSCEIQNIRWPGAFSVKLTQAEMHHFSYVRTDKEMLIKISTKDDTKHVDWLKWYDEVWLPWTPEREDLHPVAPTQFKRAVYRPLSKEIKALL